MSNDTYILLLKIVEALGIIAFGIVMRVAIDEMQLPVYTIPIFKIMNVIGVVTMLYCTVTT